MHKGETQIKNDLDSHHRYACTINCCCQSSFFQDNDSEFIIIASKWIFMNASIFKWETQVTSWIAFVGFELLTLQFGHMLEGVVFALCIQIVVVIRIELGSSEWAVRRCFIPSYSFSVWITTSHPAEKCPGNFTCNECEPISKANLLFEKHLSFFQVSHQCSVICVLSTWETFMWNLPSNSISLSPLRILQTGKVLLLAKRSFIDLHTALLDGSACTAFT